MKLKGLLKKTGAVILASALLCGGAATVLPQVAESGIEVSAAGSSFASATKINVNQNYTDNIADGDENDYFRFTLSSDSKVSFSFSHNYIGHGESYWYLHLYKDNNSYDEVYSCGFAGNEKTTKTLNLGLPKGTYYIKITNDWYYTTTIDYTVRVNADTVDNWEKEFNDEFDSADKISLNKNYNGAIQDGNDYDFYRFTLSSDSKVSFSFSHNYIGHGESYWYLHLYKDNNSYDEVYSCGFAGNEKTTKTLNLGLPKGTYYIKITNDWYYTTTIDYTVRVNADTVDNWEKEFNDEFDSADKISLNKNYYGALSESDDKDFYKFSLSSSAALILTFNHPFIDSDSDYWTIKLYKDNNTNEEIQSINYQGNKTVNSYKLTLSRGTYYLRVSDNWYHSSNDYTVSVGTPDFNKPVTLSKTTLSLGKGEALRVTASGGNGGIKWRTSNSKIVTVDQNGDVKGVNNGTAWVTARGNNGKEKSCKVIVKNAPSKISLTKGLLTLGVGESFNINSNVNSGAASANRTYRTSNSRVVKMTKTTWTGIFKGVAPGVAYVTVRTYNGKESTCKVTVKAAPTSVTISKKTLNLKVGATATLSCSIPSNAGCATRTFRTSNSNVVKMIKTNWTGSFKAVAPGTAYVTVRTYNGKETSCKVTVQ